MFCRVTGSVIGRRMLRMGLPGKGKEEDQKEGLRTWSETNCRRSV